MTSQLNSISRTYIYVHTRVHMFAPTYVTPATSTHNFIYMRTHANKHAYAHMYTRSLYPPPSTHTPVSMFIRGCLRNTHFRIHTHIRSRLHKGSYIDIHNLGQAHRRVLPFTHTPAHSRHLKHVNIPVHLHGHLLHPCLLSYLLSVVKPLTLRKTHGTHTHAYPTSRM